MLSSKTIVSKLIPLLNNIFLAVKISVLLYSVFSPIIARLLIPVFTPKSIICSISSSCIFPSNQTFLFLNFLLFENDKTGIFILSTAL